MEYIRHHYNILVERLSEPRRFIQVIAGPRQVGKSTLVRQVLEKCAIAHTSESADTVDHNDKQWIANLWESVRVKMRLGKLDEFILVIDEIHKIDNWSEQVKREWDADTRNGTNIKVVLLGSSRMLIKAGLNESLAGRFELIRMLHWSYNEMRDAFGWSIEQYVYFGGFPGAAPLAHNERRWKAYLRDAIIEPSVEKDVILTTNIYKPALMRQLFDVGCANSGTELSLNKIAGQLQDVGNVTTLANYLHALGESQLLTGLKKFAAGETRKYNSIPKLMVFNTALLSSNFGQGFEREVADPKRWGRWVESAVGAHLLCNAGEFGYNVFYWRENNLEVDFVITYQDQVIAIEVKSGRRTTNEGIRVFVERFKPKSAFVVGSGGVPLEDFLLSDPSLLF